MEDISLLFFVIPYIREVVNNKKSPISCGHVRKLGEGSIPCTQLFFFLKGENLQKVNVKICIWILEGFQVILNLSPNLTF